MKVKKRNIKQFLNANEEILYIAKKTESTYYLCLLSYASALIVVGLPLLIGTVSFHSIEGLLMFFFILFCIFTLWQYFRNYNHCEIFITNQRLLIIESNKQSSIRLENVSEIVQLPPPGYTLFPTKLVIKQLPQGWRTFYFFNEKELDEKFREIYSQFAWKKRY